MSRPPGPTASRIALFVYLSMIGAVAIALVMSVALQSASVFPPGSTSGAMGAVPLAVAGAAVLVFISVRRRLPERRTGETDDQWWQANMPSAIVLWATAEGAALVGAVFYLVGGSPTSLAATALGLALLAFSTPSSLAGR
jgi:hypothetical protein